MYVKQVIVVRKDLKMRTGKIAAQAAHASMKVFFDKMIKLSEYRYSYGVKMKNARMLPELSDAEDQWIDGSFTKVCVSVNSEAELLEIYTQAQASGLSCALITDSGKTEFHGVPTNTCIAIGPDDAEKIDPLTRHLPLM